jgi:formate dehydrogenase subunit gamma
MTERVLRFTRTERAVHWVQATSFLVLLISGYALALPAVEAVLGHRAVLREVHLSAAFFLFFGPAVVALAGDRTSVAEDVRAVEVWDEDDLRWLAPPPLRGPAPAGRFNAGQKLNAIFVAWSTLAFALSGLIMWQNRRFPLGAVQRANVIHTDLAYLALLVFLGHLYLSAVNPATRPSLSGMVGGWVDRAWALAHHPRWEATVGAEPRPRRREAAWTAARIALGAAVVLFAVRVFFFYLGANVTDAVTSWLYGLTAWPGVAVLAPRTGVRIADWPAIPYLLAAAGVWLLAQSRGRSRPVSDRVRQKTTDLEVSEVR